MKIFPWVHVCVCVCFFFGQACNTRPLCRFDRKIIANIFIDNRVVWFKCMVQLWIWAHVAIPKEIRLHVYCTRSESVWPNAMERENKKNIAVIFIRHRHYNCMDVSFFCAWFSLTHSTRIRTDLLSMSESLFAHSQSNTIRYAEVEFVSRLYFIYCLAFNVYVAAVSVVVVVYNYNFELNSTRKRERENQLCVVFLFWQRIRFVDRFFISFAVDVIVIRSIHSLPLFFIHFPFVSSSLLSLSLSFRLPLLSECVYVLVCVSLYYSLPAHT